MTNHSMTGRLAGLPKNYIQAWKTDTQKSPDDPRQVKIFRSWQKVAQNHPKESTRKRYQKLINFAESVMDKKAAYKRSLLKQLRSYRIEIRAFAKVAHSFVVHGFDNKSGFTCPGYSVDAQWKEGVRTYCLDSTYESKQWLARVKIAIADLARRIYPNSPKVAPHASDVTWNGNKDNRWTDYVIRGLRLKDFFSISKPHKFDKGDESDYYYLPRLDAWKEQWEGIKAADRVWLCSKYLGEPNEPNGVKGTIKEAKESVVEFRNDHNTLGKSLKATTSALPTNFKCT